MINIVNLVSFKYSQIIPITDAYHSCMQCVFGIYSPLFMIMHGVAQANLDKQNISDKINICDILIHDKGNP